MNRAEKHSFVNKLKQKFNDDGIVILLRQNKLTVANSCDLRAKMRNQNSSYVVVKNTLAKIAITDTGFEHIKDHLKNQTALAFSKSPIDAAKVAYEYSSKSEGKLQIICGCYDGKVLSFNDVKTLAQLPSMDELRAKLIAIIQASAQKLACVTQAPATKLVRVIKCYSEKMEEVK